MDDTTEIAGLRNYPLARRGMMMTGLISGFTLATQRAEAQAIHTDSEGLEVGETEIPTDKGRLPAYFAHPAKHGEFPVVLVNEEIFGVHEYIKDICRRLAKQGYLAVATEYYARIADLSKMTDASQIVKDVISKAPDAQYMADLDSTTAWAVQHRGSSTRVGVIGFCRGGRQTWLYAAHSPHLKAAVAFYGPIGGTPSPIQPRTVLDLADQIKCPLLGLYGGQDPSIPVDLVRQAEAKAKAAHKLVDIVIYPDAGHGFHADYRPSYRQADAEDAWKRAMAWLRRFGVTPAG
ncbi:dienelactone hydrolase family protein [Rhodopila sp.]|uniref:dienelactone hydrolase family protein n=1 Tax=Rhodopila sp. TaxID=2480087 RepID=UPI003D10D7BF